MLSVDNHNPVEGGGSAFLQYVFLRWARVCARGLAVTLCFILLLFVVCLNSWPLDIESCWTVSALLHSVRCVIS